MGSANFFRRAGCQPQKQERCFVVRQVATLVTEEMQARPFSELLFSLALLCSQVRTLGCCQLRIAPDVPIFYFTNVCIIQAVGFIDKFVYFELFVRRIIIVSITFCLIHKRRTGAIRLEY